MEAIKGNMGQRGPSHFRFPHRLPLPVAGASQISPSTRFTSDKWHRRAAGHAGQAKPGGTPRPQGHGGNSTPHPLLSLNIHLPIKTIQTSVTESFLQCTDTHTLSMCLPSREDMILQRMATKTYESMKDKDGNNLLRTRNSNQF